MSIVLTASAFIMTEDTCVIRTNNNENVEHVVLEDNNCIINSSPAPELSLTSLD